MRNMTDNTSDMNIAREYRVAIQCYWDRIAKVQREAHDAGFAIAVIVENAPDGKAGQIKEISVFKRL